MSNTYYKVTVTAKITCQTALHVGGIEDPKKLEKSRYKNLPESEELSKTDGETESLPTYRQCTHRKGSDDDISETDFYIPANTINGFIRRLATEYFSQEKISSLLGAEKSTTERKGGKLSISRAYRSPSDAEIKPNVKNGWDTTRKTLINTYTRIDDRIGTTKHQHLYHIEQHPIGTTFMLQLEAYYLTESEFETLYTLLRLWENNSQLPIGANKTKSWGITKLKNLSFKTYKISSMQSVIFGKEEITPKNWTEEDDNIAKKVLPTLPNKKAYHLTFTTEQPLLINDTNRVSNNDKKGTPKKHYYLNSNNEIVIPAKTLAGALRTQVRKYQATQALGDSTEADDIKTALETADKVVAELFGGEQQSSCLRFEDAVLQQDSDASPEHQQTLVPIDRITGAACQGQGSKSVFSVKALTTGLTFTANIYPFRELSADQSKLVKAVIAQLCDTGLWLGGDKARGFGLLSLSATDADCQPVEPSQREEVPINAADNSVDLQTTDIEHSNLKAIYNPYAMVSIAEQPTAQLKYPKTDDFTSNLRHDIDLPNCYSGVLRCQLTTMTDVFVGAGEAKNNADQQGNDDTSTDVSVGAGETSDNNEPKLYQHYKRNGVLAFPASSIRGMIGSVMETISQSRLRVVEDQKPLTKRMTMSDGSMALGKVQRNGNDFFIIPLTLPPLAITPKVVDGKNINEIRANKKLWKKLFKGKKLSDCLPIRQNADDVNHANNEIQYATVSELNQLTLDAELPIDDNSLDELFLIKRRYNKKKRRTDKVIIGQKISQGNTRTAIIRKMNKHNNNFPRNCHYVLAIPENNNHPNRIAIPKTVVNEFNELLSEATNRFKKQYNEDRRNDANAVLTEVARPEGREYDTCSLQEGQIVYFDIKEVKGEISVSRLSYSALWRKFHDKKSVYESLPQAFRPWGTAGNQQLLTPAEALLGVVEEGKSGQQRNLASRLRFTDAIAVDGEALQQREREQEQGEQQNEDPYFTLKALSTPKLPSPNLYFSANGKMLNGRKHYLRQQHGDMVNEKGKQIPIYQSNTLENPKLKVRCQPVKAGQTTSFDIHFQNLNENELKLLAASISPDETFQHKLGLGKPLGLGSVKLAIQSVKLLNTGNQKNIESILKREKDNGEDGNGEYVDKAAFDRLCKLGEPIALSDGMLNYPMTEENLIKLRDNEITTRTNPSEDIEGIQHAEYRLFDWHTRNKKNTKLAEQTLVIKATDNSTNE